MAERVYVACDVSNLWYACKREFGVDARVDFQVLSELIPAIRRPHSVSQHLVAYIVSRPSQKHHPFYMTLKGYGYSVKERFMRFEKGVLKPTGTDWDVGITVDAMAQIDHYDTFVLASGDGDFAPLLRHLKAKQKRTTVLTFDSALSKTLAENCDELVKLTKSSVYLTTGEL